jgi:UDP-N-acetylglucosamine/UDP-N-acetylgalactosamine diphosphorylase
MTSDANDRETRDFFAVNKYFGLSPDRVTFFIQGMWPALTEDGKVILESPARIFMSPDGHGGILNAMLNNRVIADMKQRGLKTLFYFQVDNPMVNIAEPAFIGVHCDAGADMSVKVCAKRGPDEPIGVVVRRGGRDAVVEYTELTQEQKNERLPDGNLRFRFGSVAIHIFSLAFLEKEAKSHLPLHLAHKKIPYCGDKGEVIKPDKPNGYKFEKFIFDVVPDAAKVLNVEFAREDEFSPVKNKEGDDSPQTTRRDMVRKCARWFRQCGVDVPMGQDREPLYKIEIDPCYANEQAELAARLKPDIKIAGDLLLR